MFSKSSFFERNAALFLSIGSNYKHLLHFFIFTASCKGKSASTYSVLSQVTTTNSGRNTAKFLKVVENYHAQTLEES